MTVWQAVPCRAVEGVGARTHSCEPEPSSMSDACIRIGDMGLLLVGWYHRCVMWCDGFVSEKTILHCSHPVFNCNPSVVDIRSQLEYQTAFKRDDSHFVGLIVGAFLNFIINIPLLHKPLF